MTHTQDDHDEEKKQYWSKYFGEELSVNGIVLRKALTAKVKRLENNRHFWRGVFDGASTERTQ